MTNALATEQMLVAPTVTPEQLELVRRTVANGATPDELKLYLYDCARQGVHPLDKLVHFTKRGGKYAPITSIDFMRIRAADTGEMAGSEDPSFTAEDEKSHPLTATMTVYRVTQGHRYPYTATARWSEYKPEQNDFMWRKMPYTMLGKCAEALALRKGFPRQLAGLYAREEMEQADKSGYVVEAPGPIREGEPENVAVPTTGESSGVNPQETEYGNVSDRAKENYNATIPLRIMRVLAGAGGSRAQIVFSDGTELPVYTPQLAALAEQIAQEGVPVVIETRTSAAGKVRLEKLSRMGSTAPVEAPAPQQETAF